MKKNWLRIATLAMVCIASLGSLGTPANAQEFPVTERTLKNRALAITHRLQGMDELQRHQYVAEAVRRL